MLGQARLPEIADDTSGETVAPRRPAATSTKPSSAACSNISSFGHRRGHFGDEEHGTIQPTPAEVRAITENHAERQINLVI
jgi:hypothetical protein